MTLAKTEGVSTGMKPPWSSVGRVDGWRPIVTQCRSGAEASGPDGRLARRLCGCDPVFSGPLCPVEGGICGRQQLVHAALPGERGHADARGHGQARAIRRNDDTLCERLANALAEEGAAGEVRARQGDDELLSAPAAGEVDLAHGSLQSVGELAQHLVAGRVAVAVVHQLEVVEV